MEDLGIISTSCGMVKGKIVDVKFEEGKKVYVYRNIPFAKPPIGNLRFMAPQPAERWTGVKDCTTPGNLPFNNVPYHDILLQYLPLPDPEDAKLVYSEDCLHLSVYTPHPVKGKNLPVMVWFFSGGFIGGAEWYYDGSVLAGMNDVVVVVPNYRLGIFGFFSLGPSSSCTGNAGLLDQNEALKWVQKNIEAFGGNKNNVTIFGESAGGISVNHHLLSPMSRGLFHRAISHSGQSTMPDRFQSESVNMRNVKTLLDHLKIQESDDFKILQNLQKIPALELLNIAFEQTKVSYMVLDNKFFLKSPEEYLKDKDFFHVPYIIGCNSTEGYGMMQAKFPPKNLANGHTEEEIYKQNIVQMSDEGMEKCKEFYLKKDDRSQGRFSKMLGNIFGDSKFITQAVRAASAYMEAGAPIYFYYGNFRLRMFNDAEYSGNVGKSLDGCVCDHLADVLLTFGLPFTHQKMRHGARFTKDERELSRRFMIYLTNFARTGNPNEGKSVNVYWPKYEREKNHLVVQIPFSTGKNLCENIVDFWSNTMPSYMGTKNS